MSLGLGLALVAALGLGLALIAPAPARAAALLQQHCAAPPALSVQQQDRLLRFAAFIKATLDASGQPLAIVARAGLDLSRFGLRYSHGGISLRASPNAPWSVRQLYYDCEAGRPRLFDQGVPGFLLGADDPAQGWFSALLLPAPAAAALEAQALDPARAAQALHPRYSANAHAWALQYQNCNQWLVETLALAWAPLGPAAELGGAAEGPALADTAKATRDAAADPADPSAPTPPRVVAQAWLRSAGYQPQVLAVHQRWLMWLASALPWLHEDDHPAEDLAAGVYRVSMPASIDAFVRQREPLAQWLEFCHNGQHMLLRRNGAPIAAGCVAEAGDEVLPF